MWHSTVPVLRKSKKQQRWHPGLGDLQEAEQDEDRPVKPSRFQRNPPASQAATQHASQPASQPGSLTPGQARAGQAISDLARLVQAWLRCQQGANDVPIGHQHFEAPSGSTLGKQLLIFLLFKNLSIFCFFAFQKLNPTLLNFCPKSRNFGENLRLFAFP